jgi:hypothetical protein
MAELIVNELEPEVMSSIGMEKLLKYDEKYMKA